MFRNLNRFINILKAYIICIKTVNLNVFKLIYFLFIQWNVNKNFLKLSTTVITFTVAERFRPDGRTYGK